MSIKTYTFFTLHRRNFLNKINSIEHIYIYDRFKTDLTINILLI